MGLEKLTCQICADCFSSYFDFYYFIKKVLKLAKKHKTGGIMAKFIKVTLRELLDHCFLYKNFLRNMRKEI